MPDLSISSPRHEKSPPRAGRSVAQRRGISSPLWARMQSVFCERLDGFGYASREPRGVSSSLFPAQIKRAPTSGTPSIWRREEDVRRLRLESVVPRGGTVRVFGLGVRASLARTSGENQISQISSPRHEKSPPRAGRSVPLLYEIATEECWFYRSVWRFRYSLGRDCAYFFENV